MNNRVSKMILLLVSVVGLVGCSGQIDTNRQAAIVGDRADDFIDDLIEMRALSISGYFAPIVSLTVAEVDPETGMTESSTSVFSPEEDQRDYQSVCQNIEDEQRGNPKFAFDGSFERTITVTDNVAKVVGILTIMVCLDEYEQVTIEASVNLGFIDAGGTWLIDAIEVAVRSFEGV